eukprot:12971807-Alexandrium_andersonii.AAC.1
MDDVGQGSNRFQARVDFAPGTPKLVKVQPAKAKAQGKAAAKASMTPTFAVIKRRIMTKTKPDAVP